ncbi:MAG: hypothetical protein NVSMB27_27000 [Ktedonobacteraceae bacterium]
MLILLVGIVVIALLIGRNVQFFVVGSAKSIKPAPIITTSKVIIHENALAGTDGWEIPRNKDATIQIQAYTSATSVLPGHKLTFYVSTQHDGTLYSIDIYRLGWYGGAGGRLITSIPGQRGLAQGYFDVDAGDLVNCASCRVDRKTGLVEANWQPSYVLTIPPDWVTGVYLAKFSDASGMQTYAPFDVRGNVRSAYVAVTAYTTYEAYNGWGGYSLYPYNSLNTNGIGRAVKVSFDRPYSDWYGSGGVLFFEADVIHWLERQGYDLSYISNADLHSDPSQLLQHRVYLSLGHDEYWTKEMRDGVEHARDSGVSLAFLGANASYWQMRFEPDSMGVPNRTIVCYKVETMRHTLASDPLYGRDNARVTSQWRDPVIGRPENALIGVMFSDYIQQHRGFPWMLSTPANSPLLKGTGLQAGVPYGCALVGYEWDRVFSNGSTPRGLQVLGLSYTISVNYYSDTSNTAYYFAPSGAMVFATGSVYWTTALDGYRLVIDTLCAGHDAPIPEIEKLMANVMQALATHHLSS